MINIYRYCFGHRATQDELACSSGPRPVICCAQLMGGRGEESIDHPASFSHIEAG